jgi:hypothetical protein
MPPLNRTTLVRTPTTSNSKSTKFQIFGIERSRYRGGVASGFGGMMA